MIILQLYAILPAGVTSMQASRNESICNTIGWKASAIEASSRHHYLKVQSEVGIQADATVNTKGEGNWE